ncbi:MAG TPA: hypothetical protein VFV99_10960 [Kofleriaceae bacterium]|nr:hypothetical protein [Kofleriaceae bacterium]
MALSSQDDPARRSESGALRFGRARRLATWAKPYAPTAVIVALALFIVWAFAATTLHYAGSMGLPLDDSYIYLTYAKQFGRAEPFTYFPGGGYSAGSTSVLWPMLLAPFWTLGARGHALVWVSYGMCAVLYAAVAISVYRFVAKIRDPLSGLLGAVMVLVIAPFAWCALSGMEVALAAALLVATLLLLLREPNQGRPSGLFIACLAAASLSRPEATLLVGAIVAVRISQRLRARNWRAAAWWLAPLAPVTLWLLANKLIAGNFFPNTGVAKSHFYLPGFDWAYWRDAVTTLSGRMLRSLFWDKTSPLIWPRLVAALFLVGAVRVGIWAWREKQFLVGTLVIVAPFVMMLAVIASSGLWSFQNYRYIAPAFPLLLIPVAIALSPAGKSVALRRAWHAGGIALVILFARSARPGLVADMRLFAQGGMDTNTQVVAIGKYLHRKLPDARVMFHDAGAIAYYGDGRVYDMLGLVTNHQAGIANNGPGARFEFLESLPTERRPTHFAYYPGWMGTPEFFGEALMHTYLRPGIEGRRLVGEGDMQVLTANWDHAHSGERPLNDHTGWTITDRVDIADIASERSHGWVGRMGRRKFGDPTARWSIVERETINGLVIDGGRTIRAGGERFTVHVDPGKPTRVVLRTGGQKSYGWHEAIDKPVTITLFVGKKQLGQLVIAPPAGQFSELTFNLPAHALPTANTELHVEANGIYRVFHWFVLQPE